MTTSLSSRPKQNLLLEQEHALATFWQQATPGTTYYRCYLPAMYLPGQCLWLKETDLQWDDVRDELVMPRQRGAAVWQFLGDHARTKIAYGQQMLGIRVLMEADDNYLVPNPPVPGQQRFWFKTIKEAANYRGEIGYSNEKHRLIAADLDGIIVATPYLRKQYLEYNDNVYLCRNQIEPADWVDLEEKDPDVLRIVYSGSPSHQHDAPYVTKAFKWAARQPGVEVWVQGFMPRGWTFAKAVPWTEGLAQYRRKLGSFDVGVAPLRPGKWANGKSDLKALEYGIAGVLPLVAREEPYLEFGEVFPDLLVDSDERAWLDAVKAIVKNRDQVKQKADEVKQYVLEHRTIEKNIDPWREAINGSA